VTQCGGKLLGGISKIEIADGDWLPAGVVALEFESLQNAKEWFNSADYRAAVGGVIFVDEV